MPKSLRSRLTIIFIGLAIGPIVLLGLAIGQRSFISLEQQSLIIQRNRAAKVGAQIGAFIDARSSELQLLDQVHKLGTLDLADQRAILANMLMTRRVYQEIVLLDISGQEKIRISRLQTYLEDDLENRSIKPEFLLPVSRSSITFSPVYFDQTIREPLVTISVPLLDRRTKEIESVLVADLRFKSIWDLLAGAEWSDQQDVYVTDLAGMVVAHRNPSIVLRGTTVALPEKEGRATGLSGAPVYSATEMIDFGEQSIVVVAEQTVSAALDIGYNNLRVSILITTLVLISALFLVFLVIRSIVQPINTLSSFAELVSAGEFAQVVDSSASDAQLIPQKSYHELDELAESFQAMVLALQERDSSMAEQKKELQRAHDELEIRVKERTADLAETNQFLTSEIAARKEIEQALREERDRAQQYFDIAGSMLVVLDVNGKVALINKRGSEILDAPINSIVGQDWFEVFIPERLRIEVKEVYQKLMTGKIEMAGYYENPVLTAAGEEKSIGWSNTILRDTDGTIVGTLSSGTDLTHRKKMEEEMLKAQKLESIGVLAGGIAHDFNNILTSILGNISLAKLEIGPHEDSAGTLGEAEKACFQLKDLTQQLLTFSVGGEPIKGLVSIGDLVQEACGFALRGSNVKSAFTLADPIWPVEVDRGQINQVINNLIINAKQAMPGGGMVHLSVENCTIDEEELPLTSGRYIRITVRDQGIGISEDHLQSIFDPYFTTKGQGSGLGLAISYSVVKRHGGHISVESKLDEGTNFAVYLPASDKIPSVAENAQQSLQAGHGRLLVMDDQQSVRRVLCRMLERLGYEVEAAENGEEAISLYRQALDAGKRFDGVILDLTVPGGMGGRKAMEKLVEIDPGVRGIVSSGYSNDPVMAEFADHGFCGIITKPFELKELGLVLRELIPPV